MAVIREKNGRDGRVRDPLLGQNSATRACRLAGQRRGAQEGRDYRRIEGLEVAVVKQEIFRRIA